MTGILDNVRGRILLSLALSAAIGVSANCRPAAGADTAPAPKVKTNQADDEKAIRATADEFVKAFNAGDARTIGAEWSTDAEYTDENGQEFHGRTAIEKEYAALFKEHPGATISVNISSIRFLGPDIAIEKGVASVKSPKGEPTAARYSVVHARRGGKWVMVVGRDLPYVAGNGDYLKDLEWMIGDWKADGIRAGLQIKSEWLAGRNFIKNTYTTTADGKTTLTGAQIIGWNPRLGRIVGWHFDAEGGFGNDLWTKEGNKWVIEATGTFRDGSESSAVNTVAPIDANSFNFQSAKRTLDHVSLPDLGPLKIVRATAAK
jgi:uncharacterized protein (TIGR02246 family)